MKKEEYVEMYIDDMKAAKESWQSWLRVAKRLLIRIQSIEETKTNRWELKSLEKSYGFFIDQMKKMVSIYGKLIDLAEDCELEESYFLDAMKELQRVNNDLKKEYNKKSFRQLNNEYVHGIKVAEVITSV